MRKIIFALGLATASAMLAVLGGLVGYFVTALALAAMFPAHAEVPTVGSHWGSDMTILCDTKDQIRTIVKAGQDGRSGMLEAYNHLKDIKNDRGERTCTIMPIGQVMVTEVEDVGVFTNPDGQKYHGWMLSIVNGSGITGAALHAEDAEAVTTPESMPDGGTTLRPMRDLCSGRSASSLDGPGGIRLFYCS